MRISRLFLILLAFIFVSALYSPVIAQGEGQGDPYYIVQKGDSLWQIAARFRVTVESLQHANNLSDPGQVVIGSRLQIPGLSGLNAWIDTITVPYGETLRSLSRRYGVSELVLARLNRLISPTELYAGAPLIVPVREGQSTTFAGRTSLTSGQSLLERAVVRGENPWSLTQENNLPGTWSALRGDVLQVNGSSQESTPSGLPEPIMKVEVEPVVGFPSAFRSRQRRYGMACLPVLFQQISRSVGLLSLATGDLIITAHTIPSIAA